MTQDTTSECIVSRLQIDDEMRSSANAIALALLMVLSLFAMAYAPSGSGVAAAEETNESEWFADFEDGDLSGWSHHVESDPDSDDDTGWGDIVIDDTESFWGTQSMFVDSEAASSVWDTGPTFSTQENFEVSGTIKQGRDGAGDGDDLPIRLGLVDDDYDYAEDGPPDGDVAVLAFDYGDETIDFGTSWGSDNTGEFISGEMYEDQWVQFRIQFDGGEARAKVWEAGISEPEEWQIVSDYSDVDVEGSFYVQNRRRPSTDDVRQIWVDELDAGGHAISGQVVDQYGEPVPDATVEATGVDFERLDDVTDDIEDDKEALMEEADNLLDEAQDPLPDEWDADFSLDGYLNEHTTNNYVLAHNPRDYDEGFLVGGGGVLSDDQIDDPRLQLDGDANKHLFSVWDPTDTTINPLENPLDGSFPGTIDGGDKLVIEQLDPKGGVVKTWEREPNAEVTFERAVWSDIERDIHSIKLPEGHFYRIYPESNEAAAYTVVSGNADDIREQIVHNLMSEVEDLEDDAQELSAHGQNIQENIDEGTYERSTTTTDANGEFTLRVNTRVERAAVQAYRGDGDLLTDITGPSISDLREITERGYNGSVYMTLTPERTDVPADDVTIEVVGHDSPPWMDLDDLEDLDGVIDDIMDEFDYDELEDRFGDLLDEHEIEELDEMAEDMAELIEQNEDLEESLLEAYEDIDSLDELLDEIEGDEDELKAAIEEMSNEIENLEDLIEEIDSGSDIDDGTASAWSRFSGDIDPDGVKVLGHWSDGETFIVDDEYVSVDSSGSLLPGGAESTEVRVDDYPVEDGDPANLQFEFVVAGDEGVGQGEERIVNPTFGGNVPDLDSVSFSTLRPSTGDYSTVSINSDDPAFGELVGVDVTGPDGQPVGTEEVADGHRFQTSDEGIHTVEVSYSESSTDEVFVERLRIKSEDTMVSDKPTIRAVQGVSGEYAVVGDGIVDGEIRTDDGVANVNAYVDDPDTSEIHVSVQELDRDVRSDIDVQVLRKSDGATVNRHVEMLIHTHMHSDALTYRDGNPLTPDGATVHGEIRSFEGKDVIHTYTNEDGQVSVSVSEDPGIVERILYTLQVRSPVSIPFASGAVILGAIAIAFRRRLRAGLGRWFA